MINIIASSRYRINRRSIKAVAQDILTNKGYSEDNVLNIVFVGRIKMKKIASEYKNENIALPVLSFAYGKENTGEDRLLGEVIICYPQAVLLAAEREKKVDETLIALIDHGIDNILKEINIK